MLKCSNAHSSMKPYTEHSLSTPTTMLTASSKVVRTSIYVAFAHLRLSLNVNKVQVQI